MGGVRRPSTGCPADTLPHALGAAFVGETPAGLIGVTTGVSRHPGAPQGRAHRRQKDSPDPHTGLADAQPVITVWQSLGVAVIRLGWDYW